MVRAASESLDNIQKLWGRDNYSKFINVLHSEGYVNDRLLANLSIALKEKKVVKEKKSMKEQIAERKAAGNKPGPAKVNGDFVVAVDNGGGGGKMIIEEKSKENGGAEEDGEWCQ